MAHHFIGSTPAALRRMMLSLAGQADPHSPPATYLVRHCQASGQEPDAPLTPEGQRQAAALADYFAPVPIERIVSSPFLRARLSIAPLVRRISVSMTIDDRLRERTLAADPLLRWRERLRDSFDDPTLAFPGGESSAAAMARGRAAVEAARNRPTNAMVVTHGNLLTLILRSFDPRFGFDAWERMTNPDVFRIGADGQVTRVWRDGA